MSNEAVLWTPLMLKIQFKTVSTGLDAEMTANGQVYERRPPW